MQPLGSGAYRGAVVGNDVPGSTIDGGAQVGDVDPSTKPTRWWPSRRLIIVAAIVLGVIVLGLLTWVVVDQLTRASVPAAEGETVSEATAMLEDAGFTVEVDSESRFCRRGELAEELCVVSSQTPGADERVHADTVVLGVVPADVEAPVMEGMSFDEARSAASEVGLTVLPSTAADAQVEGHEDWIVLGQSALGDVKAGSSVKVRLERPLVDAPAIVGVSLATAMDALREAGFTPVATHNPGSTMDPAWVVTGSEPAVTDGKLHLGSQVKLTWGVQVPNVVGMTDIAANSTLHNAGLVAVGTKSSSQRVVTQDPAAGTIVQPGTDVTIALEPPSIVYEVVGNGSRASITWIAPGTYNISQATNESLPWRMSWPTSSGYRNFNAQILNGNSITCNIYVNGQLLKTNTSTGQYAVVSCG
jgi:beta-lactam-binding protein with PASTA domain